MNISVTEDINGQKYIRAEQKPKGLPLSQRFKDWQFIQKPKIGHWIMSDDGLYRPICDKCGAHPWKGYIPTVEEATEVFKYCPNCGCRMVEPQESEGTDG